MTGMEPFVSPLAGGLVSIVFDVARKIGGGFSQAVGDRYQASAALKRYADKYKTRYGTLKLLGMSKSVELETVYTRVRFLDELSIRQFASSIDVMEQAYREGQKRQFQTQQSSTIDGSTVANENQYLMVLGRPGAGKSTYLRRVGLEAFKGEYGNYQHRCIPVMLELKQLNSHEIKLTQAIAGELENFGFPESTEFAEKLLEQGRLLILLDGLDEVPKVHLNSVIDAIQNFVTKYDRNRYIASCRIAAHRSTWNGFHDIELADFNDDQIQQFIYNWFSSDLDRQTKTAEQCWEILNERSHIAAKELAQTPLLLMFLCLVYNRTQNFPSNRATLYGKALDILLEEWAAEKRIIPGEIYQGLNIDLEKVLLSEIAHNGFVSDQLFFTEQELVNQIKAFLSDTVDKPKYLDGKAVLNAITIQQGILIERAENIYSFSHLTLQEFLTAKYISQDSELINKIVEQNLFDRRWREVFLLVAGSIRNADKLLELIHLKSQQYISSSKLIDLFLWASKITNSLDENFSELNKRAAVITLALTLLHMRFFSEENEDLPKKRSPFYQARRSAYSIVGSLRSHLTIRFYRDKTSPGDDPRPAFNRSYNPNVDLELAYEFAEVDILKDVNLLALINSLRTFQSEAPHESQPLEVRNNYSMRVHQTWLDALHLQQELLVLSDEEVELLANYLYANELIVQCKEAAVRVSEKVWQEIEKKMLTVEA
jgi:hypothetical protein